jgi:arsenite methyltransferase
VSGALAERVFAKKLEKAGFDEIWVGGHRPYGVDDIKAYPLFTSELIATMRRLIPLEQQDRVAVGVIVKARKPF